MEWSFDSPAGCVTVREEGDRAVCQAIRRESEEGLYKAWLRGSGGRFLLGTLIPEGGALRLRRNIPIFQLRRQCVWPPTGGEIVMAFPFTEETPPEGFRWESQPERLMCDPLLAQSVRPLGRVLMKREEQGFSLAIKYSAGAPFPLPPLFCLSRVERLEGKPYLFFAFSSEGRPVLPYNPSQRGEAREEETRQRG